MLLIAIVVLAATGLALAGYAGPAWRQQLLPIACRAVAWSAIGVLLLNPGCPAPARTQRPLVLLDASLSMTAAGGRWREALDSARVWGDVRPFGDPERRLDTVPEAGASRLSEALDAARATGRPVIVVSDGELSDAMEPGLKSGLTVRLFPRRAGPAAAIASTDSPARLTVRDTLRIRAVVRGVGLGSRRLPVVLEMGGRPLARATAELPGDGEAEVTLTVPPGTLPAGSQLLRVALAEAADPERRDDARVVQVAVSEVPGIAVAASPGDWDARFLFRALQQVTALPVAGFVRLDASGWRRMTDLSRVDDASVRDAMTRADLLVLRGEGALDPPARTRTALLWPAAAGGSDRAGDWYLSPGTGGPTPGALAGFTVDSFPPATAVLPMPADTPAWVGLTAQLGRRGAPRPVLAGYSTSGHRRVVLLADGLWRWAFRGGASEQAYRAVVASTVDWLLALPDEARGRAVPVRAVVPNGRPVLFERSGRDTLPAVAIRVQSEGGPARTDTLRFGPEGRAALWLSPGSWAYRIDGGGEGRVVVEEWSPEWFPGPITLQAGQGSPPSAGRTRGLRESWWIYAAGVLALCAEWLIRRRRGLR